MYVLARFTALITPSSGPASSARFAVGRARVLGPARGLVGKTGCVATAMTANRVFCRVEVQ